MKQPRILYAEAQFAPGQRAAFPSSPQLKPADDMEIEAIWFAADDLNTLAPVDDLLRVNFSAKGWPPTTPGSQPVRSTLLGTLPADRTHTIAQVVTSAQAWYWRFRYPYRILKDGGFVLQVQNTIVAAGAVNRDSIAFGAHCVGRDEVPHKPRVLVCEGDALRAAVAPQSIGGIGAIAAGSNMNDGREELDVLGVSFARLVNVQAVNQGILPNPRLVYVQVRPVGKDQWSEVPVPLAAYGVHRMPDDSGTFWVPGAGLVLPRGVAPDIDCQYAAVAGNNAVVRVAILGYVDVDEMPETEKGI